MPVRQLLCNTIVISSLAYINAINCGRVKRFTRLAHNQEITGSIPVPASKIIKRKQLMLKCHTRSQHNLCEKLVQSEVKEIVAKLEPLVDTNPQLVKQIFNTLPTEVLKIIEKELIRKMGGIQ